MSNVTVLSMPQKTPKMSHSTYNLRSVCVPRIHQRSCRHTIQFSGHYSILLVEGSCLVVLYAVLYATKRWQGSTVIVAFDLH